VASTYSDLKIELIGTGEQSGTWGITTNTNLGTALEEAIVGLANANFASDADLTLTLSNSNATQVARHFALNVTSSVSLTVTRNLVVPAIEKPYLIANNTTGGQSIIVKNSTGTGVTIPNGAETFVYNNGTDVVSAIDYLPALTLGTALPVNSGGSGATTLTGVLKGNGTSAFTAGSVSLTSEITGTLPASNGGTGITSPGTSGNVLTSDGTNWTSTAPGGGFAAGTRMSFQQTSAPTGWTKDTTAGLNDSIMRIVTGTASSGGSVAFSTFAAQTTTGAHTLATTEIPSHAHTPRANTANAQASNNGYSNNPNSSTATPVTANITTTSTGGGGSHSHTLSHNLKYHDFIIASKD